MRKKLNLITLGVTDFTRAVDFYENGLVWKKSSASAKELAVFPLGGIVLALHPRDARAQDAAVDPSGTGFSGITLSYNAHSEEEVDNVLKKVKSRVATIVKPAQKVYWGGYKDLDGHLFEVRIIHSGNRMKMKT